MTAPDYRVDYHTYKQMQAQGMYVTSYVLEKIHDLGNPLNQLEKIPVHYQRLLAAYWFVANVDQDGVEAWYLNDGFKSMSMLLEALDFWGATEYKKIIEHLNETLGLLPSDFENDKQRIDKVLAYWDKEDNLLDIATDQLQELNRSANRSIELTMENYIDSNPELFFVNVTDD